MPFLWYKEVSTSDSTYKAFKSDQTDADDVYLSSVAIMDRFTVYNHHYACNRDVPVKSVGIAHAQHQAISSLTEIV